MRLLRKYGIAAWASAVLLSASLLGFSDVCQAEGDCFAGDPVFIQRDRRAPDMANRARYIFRNRRDAHAQVVANSMEYAAAVVPSSSATMLRATPAFVKASFAVFAGSAILLAVLILVGYRSQGPKLAGSVENGN